MGPKVKKLEKIASFFFISLFKIFFLLYASWESISLETLLNYNCLFATS